MSDMRSIVKQLEPAELKKAVVSAAIQSPGTLYPAVVAMLAGCYGALFSFSPIVIGLAVVGGLASAINSGVQFGVQGDKHANTIVMRYREELKLKRVKTLLALKQKLSKHPGSLSLKQVDLFNAKYNNFVEILDQKLNPGELTYNRYLTIAEQVFLAGLDNLEHYSISKDSVKAIDTTHITQEISRLDKIKDKNNTSAKTYEELTERMRLHQMQINKADNYLLENEQALTQLDSVTTRIANINTTQSHAEVDLESAMDELKYLIDKTETYSN
ncbi:MAG: hypothetical protein ACJAYK_000145 [Crocinitomicaceae bacterium]|jgi:hypothetical protein